ncbi:MAG TPA: zf-TFIIB domain-containing protein [Phycisphaerae bacterium]|nr:zf-TFIIB domain-containing protein [Phycisphaerae bacterium]
MTTDRDELADLLAEMSSAGTECTEQSPVPPGQRPCPICGRHMDVETFLGVSIDACNDHGVWLDRGELPAMIAKVRAGKRISRTTEIRRARREGKMSGALFGAWSLLWD